MDEVEFDLAALSQELRILATTRRASRDAWLQTTLPSIARASTLCMIVAESGKGGADGEAALRTLMGALGTLSPSRADEDPSTEPHSSDGAWTAIVAAARQVRVAHEGKVAAWVVPQ